MMNDIRARAFAAFMGLGIGDAMSWQAMYHRSHLLPFWTRRIRREIDAASEESDIIRLPMPFSLNQPEKMFAVGPTDDTEWAAFTAKQLLDQQGHLDKDKSLQTWLKLANSDLPVRGSIGVQAGLANLRRGKLPPECGHDNPHYFDDSAMCRAVPIGIACIGEPERAAELAKLDAMMTNAEEGVLAAQIVAVIMSQACISESMEEIFRYVLHMTRQSSWLERTVENALTIAESSPSIFHAFPVLCDRIIDRVYSYADAAPTTLALLLVILKKTGTDFENAVITAASFASVADSLTPLVGAVAAALMERQFDYSNWLESLRNLKGICIPELEGENFITIAKDLANLAAEKASAK
ncbi:ADP-ribosylglycohydrolase family protein [candidate division KSB1 bacterium]|nr:ADP-ribosylglycohydrolase family protein [candidate division KSB1 bacterium]